MVSESPYRNARFFFCQSRPFLVRHPVVLDESAVSCVWFGGFSAEKRLDKSSMLPDCVRTTDYYCEPPATEDTVLARALCWHTLSLFYSVRVHGVKFYCCQNRSPWRCGARLAVHMLCALSVVAPLFSVYVVMFLFRHAAQYSTYSWIINRYGRFNPFAGITY